MKAILVLGAFFVSVLIALPLHALATAGVPISGIPIGLEGDPGSIVITQTKTNSAGVAVFRNVKPGSYRLVVSVLPSRPTSGGITHQDDWSSPTVAMLEISIPGQAKNKFTLLFNGKTTKATERRLAPFTVMGSKLQTVTATIVKTGGGQLSL